VAAQARTLLAKLGFADADRKSPRHDLACNYVGLNHGVLRKVIQAAAPKNIEIVNASGTLEYQVLKGSGQYSTTVGFVDVLARFTAALTVPLADPETCAKANAAAVGGADPIIPQTLESGWIKVATDFQAVIEIKISHCNVGDLIRQLRVYNEHVSNFPTRPREPWIHSKSPGWETYCKDALAKRINFLNDGPLYQLQSVGEKAGETLAKLPRITIAVVDFDIDVEYRGALRACDITPIRLGSGFEEFLATRASVGADEPPPEEI
jgi:hypothetical protein